MTLARRLLLLALVAVVAAVVVFFSVIVGCNALPGPGTVSCFGFSF